MCGIVGAVTKRDVVAILLDGLHRLEYRGYDSSGVAVLYDGKLMRSRSVGKVSQLEEGLKDIDIYGNTGIAHTRWATHGVPSQQNAHPHMTNSKVSVVHNGIIENYQEIAKSLSGKGIEFESDTDTEVISASIYDERYNEGKTFLAAVQATTAKLKGAYAIAVLDADNSNKIIVAKHGSPLVIGVGVQEYFIASDPLALQKLTQEFIYLCDGDIAEVGSDSLTIYDVEGNKVERESQHRKLNFDVVDKSGHKHFMHKEIHEQPVAVSDTYSGRIVGGRVPFSIFGVNAEELFKKAKFIQIIACGTSYHAGLVAKSWMEEYAGIPCAVDIASEFRYRKRAAVQDTLVIAISQSGETADTIAALNDINGDEAYVATLAICNVPESTLVRMSQMAILTHAGPEVGVASTKAFVTQLVVLYMLVSALSDNKLPAEDLTTLPKLITDVLEQEDAVAQMAHSWIHSSHTIFLGRGIFYPIALEGALKLKELSYIHAEAYPAGELKHGPLALVDENMPIITLLPDNELFDKVQSNIAEVAARGGEITVISSQVSTVDADSVKNIITMPEMLKTVAPILYTIPMQLLSYHVAVLKGTDVDQPRNLAKSVTVE